MGALHRSGHIKNIAREDWGKPSGGTLKTVSRHQKETITEEMFPEGGATK